MARKMLLNVLLPATGEEYEFRVPREMTVDQAVSLMSSILASSAPAFYAADGEADLMIRSGDGLAGQDFNPRETFASLEAQGLIYDGALVALA